MAGIGDCASTASTAGTAAAVEQPQLVAIRTEHQNVARTGIVDQHPAVVIFEEALERRRRQGRMAPRRRDAGGSRSAQFGARKAAQRRVRILRHHLVERTVEVCFSLTGRSAGNAKSGQASFIARGQLS